MDRYWTGSLAVAGAGGAAYGLWWSVSGGKGISSNLPSDGRVAFYAALIATAGALLGFVLTALSVLVALPSGERINFIIGTRGWQKAQRVLGYTAISLGALTLASIVGTLIDGGPEVRPPFQIVFVVVALWAAVSTAGVIVMMYELLKKVTEDRRDRPRPG